MRVCGCGCVCERFGWMDVQPKAEKDEKCCFVESFEKVEAISERRSGDKKSDRLCQL